MFTGNTSGVEMEIVPPGGGRILARCFGVL